MKFLSVSSDICRQLLSDSQSPTTPLLLANDKYCNSRSGLAPYSIMIMPDTQKQALLFSNPPVPYKWDHLAPETTGEYCIFNPHFFMNFGQIQYYEIFHPNGTHVFELTDAESVEVEKIFEKMKSGFIQ